jgi:biopolymer transport protein ExbD
MRYGSRQSGHIAKSEMTPMIDMTFQLIAFFMVVVNFSETEQSERIKLPLSELAKPVTAEVQTRITLQLTDDGTVILGGSDLRISQLADALYLEKEHLKARGDGSEKDVSIVIRADRDAQTGEVQEIIEICQKPPLGFDKFVLRARQVSV